MPARPPKGRNGANLRTREFDGAAGERDLANQGLEQRRLTHTVVAEHADDLVRADGKIDARQDRDAAIASVQIVDFEDHAAACLPR